jgi:carbon storage regulator
MLILTRKLAEKLYIGGDICVTVVRLDGGQVRLGIEAPREISVLRAELLDGRPHDLAGDVARVLPRPIGAAAVKARRPAAIRGTGSRRRARSR